MRQITFAANGDLFAVTIPGVIRRFRDANHDGQFEPDEIAPPTTTPKATLYRVGLARSH